MHLLSLLSIAVSLSAVLGASLRVARDEAASGPTCGANSGVLGNSTGSDTILYAMTPPQATCSEWKGFGSGTSGMYIISPEGGCEFMVFCDMCLDQGNDGWIVIQRRVSDEVPFHHKDWEQYKKGFGDYRYNYWIGLEKLHEITSSGSYELFTGVYDPLLSDPYKRAVYETFSVASEDQHYKLTVGSLDTSRSDIGSDDPSLIAHDGQEFTTFDHDHDGIDNVNCAQQGSLDYGGWWFGAGGSDCVDVNLNGQYYSDAGDVNGIIWQGVSQHSLHAAIMAIRKVG